MDYRSLVLRSISDFYVFSSSGNLNLTFERNEILNLDLSRSVFFSSFYRIVNTIYPVSITKDTHSNIWCAFLIFLSFFFRFLNGVFSVPVDSLNVCFLSNSSVVFRIKFFFFCLSNSCFFTFMFNFYLIFSSLFLILFLWKWSLAPVVAEATMTSTWFRSMLTSSWR